MPSIHLPLIKEIYIKPINSFVQYRMKISILSMTVSPVAQQLIKPPFQHFMSQFYTQVVDQNLVVSKLTIFGCAGLMGFALNMLESVP